MTDKTATLVRTITGWKGEARLYRMEPPVPFDNYYGDQGSQTTDHVIVSAVVAPYTGAETYIFPADADGKPYNYGELDGSSRGHLNHEQALNDAGYVVQS